MGTITKEILIGVIITLFATFCGLFFYTQYISDLGFVETLKSLQESNNLGTAIVIGAIPNLFVFWVFIRRKQDYRARGVLLVTIFTALITMGLKFF